MTITTRAQLQAARATRQDIVYLKTAARSSVSLSWTAQYDVAGSHVAILAGTSTTAGVIPVAGDAGFPLLPLNGSLTSYIDRFSLAYNATNGLTYRVSDLLWKAGAYTFNAAVVNLSSQPDYSSRLPGGSYTGTQLWVEAVSVPTPGIPTITITYTNQDGVTGRTATFTPTSNLISGRMLMMPLESGDSGVQRVESVIATNTQAGTYNVLITRTLIHVRTRSTINNGTFEYDKTGLVQLSDTAALFVTALPDGGATVAGVELLIGIIRG